MLHRKPLLLWTWKNRQTDTSVVNYCWFCGSILPSNSMCYWQIQACYWLSLFLDISIPAEISAANPHADVMCHDLRLWVQTRTQLFSGYNLPAGSLTCWAVIIHPEGDGNVCITFQHIMNEAADRRDEWPEQRHISATPFAILPVINKLRGIHNALTEFDTPGIRRFQQRRNTTHKLTAELQHTSNTLCFCCWNHFTSNFGLIYRCCWHWVSVK